MNNTNIVAIQQEIAGELKKPAVLKALVDTVFKGLNDVLIPRAIMEGMMRGFTFQNFLQKDIYAIPFKKGSEYSLVTSIDYARKVGMRSGICGKNSPVFTEKDGKLFSCEVTVQRNVDGHIGNYSALVIFSEYFKKGYDGRPSLWETKPHTMIAKVAEMHALRMACPEELSQAYVEEELQGGEKVADVVDYSHFEQAINDCKTIDELSVVWSDMPTEAKNQYIDLKNKIKEKLTPKQDESPKV